MPVPIPELSGASIIIIGDFPPEVFHPSWFVARHLLASADAEEAKIDLISPDIASFSASWLRFSAERGRLQFAVTAEPIVRIMDIAMGTVALFPESPVKLIGLNRDAHIKMVSLEAFHKVGDTLAPKECWPKEFSESDPQNPGIRGGMRSLIMEKLRTDPPGFLHMRIEPSTVLRPTGVFVGANDHFDFTKRSEPLLGGGAAEFINDRWRASMDYADHVRNSLLERIL